MQYKPTAPLKIGLALTLSIISMTLLASPDIIIPSNTLERRTQAVQSGICGLSPEARELAAFIMQDKQQQRQQLHCNASLSIIAAAKAKEMAEQQLVTHFGQGGANRRLRNSGYPLAARYPSYFSNHVESVAGGNATAEEMWNVFSASTGHRRHLLGEHLFFRQQNEIGVGFAHAPGTEHEYYWVVYIAESD